MLPKTLASNESVLRIVHIEQHLVNPFVLAKVRLTVALVVAAAVQMLSAHIAHAAGTTYVDPGATAMDNVDGNITSKLSTFGIGAVVTSAPTNSSSPYYITYDVSDSAGNAAVEGLREVIVVCKSPTTTCTASDGTLFCSTSAGLCIESTITTTTAATYPTIKLIGQAILGVTQGTSYLACPTVQPTNVICDRYGCIACQLLCGPCWMFTSGPLVCCTCVHHLSDALLRCAVLCCAVLSWLG